MANKAASSTILRRRKQSHLDICEKEDVEVRGKTTLFEEVELFHNALPELALGDVDTRVNFLGKVMRAPLMITGMTGGTREAFSVNRDLAVAAERLGLAFGLGSQRVMQRDPATAWTFAVREHAPTLPLLANIGLNQAAEQSTAVLKKLVREVGADALCVHLNAAQELTQPEGDRDFRNGYRTLTRLCDELGVPVVAKETGCGISRAVGRRLHRCGVRFVDVSGAGGTSWVRVEALRGDANSRSTGALLSEWGIPTAASLAMLRGSGLTLVASGGLRNGLDLAKAVVLGATVGGAALPIFRAYRAGGIQAATALLEEWIGGLRAVMLLTGSRSLRELRKQPLVMGPAIRAWLGAAGKRIG